MAKLVSKTYGEALFKLAMEENTLDEVAKEASAVLDAFAQNEELSKLLNHPKITREEKVSVIENIFKGNFSDTIVGFLVIIVNKGRYNDMNEIFQYFLDEVREYKNIGVAYVTSATELNDQQKKDIESRLLQVTKYVQFEMHYNVDKALIGGLIIRIGDRVVDSSIRTKLSMMAKDLSKIQLQ
ncbi:ATP synthase F1 subunit delta [Velocimicrobium porci]|uniref:ATP synthase subunit delta n=1 Tax=Velocimicrobium porci TaxID=2606634 RepID=A0A6L5XWS3_9FIRM|nr:ATP synthase F1 subunit delta [Velocimicrobium porci]MSS62881.1 ATP synthase F1 subunit delta [Velocimicrobium porci]